VPKSTVVVTMFRDPYGKAQFMTAMFSVDLVENNNIHSVEILFFRLGTSYA
jgi:hypothetical protein